MPNLFYPPHAVIVNGTGVPYANAKAYFYITLTSTPKNTFSDSALTTPNANPVVADANGVFGPIYLNTDALYRVTLNTSADVLIYTQDNIGPDTLLVAGAASLTAANTFTGASQKLSSTEPRLILDETDGGTDKRLWDLDVQTAVLKLRTRTDVDGAGKDVLSVTRGTGTAITAIVYGNATDIPTHNFGGSFLANTTVLDEASTAQYVGYKDIPQNSQSAAYQLVLADRGKHILHPSADVTARVFTIPANASVAFPTGTAVTFINQNAAGVITIAITTDTMRLAGAGTTGSRTLAANGIATAIKLTSTEWIISGTGLT